MTTTPASTPHASSAELLHAAARHRTCEFATLTRDGTPIAWPAVRLIDTDGRSGR